MDPSPDQSPESDRPDPETRKLARQLDEYVEAHFRSLKMPKHIRLLFAERLTRITGALDQHQAVVNVMFPLPALRKMLLESLVTGYMMSRLETRFFMEQNLDPADSEDDEAEVPTADEAAPESGAPDEPAVSGESEADQD